MKLFLSYQSSMDFYMKGGGDKKIIDSADYSLLHYKFYKQLWGKNA